GPVPSEVSIPGVQMINVNTAQEMYDTCIKEFEISDISVMAAAVADYTPVSPAKQKIKKSGDLMMIELKRSTDILKSLGERKRPGQVVVGFALETTDEKNNALKKLEEKNADMIILNSLKDKGAGFGYNTNKVTIFDKNGAEMKFEQKSKTEVARDIIDALIHFYYE
ncbi:MAG: phosphopantothenoylcysteine decarboxylase, partial [Bacteroidetes bacterium]|nr:phosphopantothenoylcysteine decarboxylase [Bacteroidota bacterium]